LEWRPDIKGGVVRVEKLEGSLGPACCSVQEQCANSPEFSLLSLFSKNGKYREEMKLLPVKYQFLTDLIE
jgi:hypothetical protein